MNSNISVDNNSSENKICLFGGTFNPIHKGHINMARTAAHIYGFNKIILMPTGNSYLKKNVLASDIRYQLVRLMIDGDDLFELSLYEAESTEPSYTYKTLQHYKKIMPETKIYYLIGEDSLRYIDKWKEPAIIFEHAIIIVAKRPGANTGAERELEEVALQLKNDYSADIRIFDYNMNISSTMIRNAFNEGNIDDISSYLKSEQIEYIKANKLYKV